MGKKCGDEEGRKEKEEEEREGKNLLGFPTFVELGNGRFRCKETGHDLPEHAKDSYERTKHCRLGLIDAALSSNNPPLNMFRQDPQSRSKLICKLTGVTINKTEEHIWKHISGKKFFNMLEKKEAEKQMPNGNTEVPSDLPQEDALKKMSKKKKKQKEDELEQNETLKKKKKKNKYKEGASRVVSEAGNPLDEEDECQEADFWKPPMGDHWDHDDGGNRSTSGLELVSETKDGDVEGGDAEDADDDTRELSKRTKRMSIEIGPSSFASRKKKKKFKST